VEAGEPEDKVRYTIIEDDGITLYVRDDVQADEMKIYMRKGLFKGLGVILN